MYKLLYHFIKTRYKLAKREAWLAAYSAGASLPNTKNIVRLPRIKRWLYVRTFYGRMKNNLVLHGDYLQ